jgi:PEP-CTERM motif
MQTVLPGVVSAITGTTGTIVSSEREVLRMKLIFGAFLGLLLAATASADSVWTYQGNTLDYPIGVNLPGQPTTLSPYALDGSVTLDNAGLAVAWRFTAGPETLTNLNSTGIIIHGSSIGLPGDRVNFNFWDIFLTGTDGEWISSIFEGSYSDAQDESTSGVYVRANPGSWTDPVSTPEPGTLALLGVGLAALVFKRRRKPADTTVWETLA